MITIRPAITSDADSICDITKRAFILYQNALNNAKTEVYALSETADKVLDDIKNHRVFVAVDENNSILGSIRYCALSDKLAYIYRFGVDPDINSTGVGTELISKVIEECTTLNFNAIALHTNSRYYKLARYYYGKEFFVHSTETSKGYIRALFIKELNTNPYDLTPAFKK